MAVVVMVVVGREEKKESTETNETNSKSFFLVLPSFLSLLVHQSRWLSPSSRAASPPRAPHPLATVLS